MKEKLLSFIRKEIIKNNNISDSDLIIYLNIVFGISIDDMQKEIEIGIQNGYSIEDQLEIIKSIIK